MPEWLKAIIDFFRGDRGAREKELWMEADGLRKAYRELLDDRNKLSQEIRQELTQQLDELRNEIESLRSALERERVEHQECRRQLKLHAEQIDQLKGQVTVLLQRTSDGGS